MPARNVQRKTVGPVTAKPGRKRDADHWVKGDRSEKQTPGGSDDQKSGTEPKPGKDGRVKDDSGDGA
jgi:hypothetical protein